MGTPTEKIGLFSGGKDSLVACIEADVKEVVYCRTGVGLNEEYVKETCQKFGWKLNILEPKEKESFEDFVKKYGFPHYGVHPFVMAYLKTHPIRKWHSDQKRLGRRILFISGRRKKESKRRARMKSNQEFSELDGMRFYSPIFDWSTVQVWDYIKKNSLKRSPIYATMHISGDCFCGAFSSRGEAIAMNMFHPELAKWISDLEEKYGGKWGNQTSMTEAKDQTTLDDLVCTECHI